MLVVIGALVIVVIQLRCHIQSTIQKTSIRLGLVNSILNKDNNSRGKKPEPPDSTQNPIFERIAATKYLDESHHHAEDTAQKKMKIKIFKVVCSIIHPEETLPML